ncbi:hypothetical protein RHMOL_Rhmol11G0058500 [Rhododendron molle]|uniref:Uncharacterized protein n=1 Tax=Rhododendron molle TaxID=49168 RepID=A0ACC0LP03_RHOML|nr:hypothetical protein RHMOL_Rhmol11G0058500 [Rhododendron molle]
MWPHPLGYTQSQYIRSQIEALTPFIRWYATSPGTPAQSLSHFGAKQYVKELEHLLQSLEAQKLLLLQGGTPPHDTATAAIAEFFSPPFSQFIVFPQYTLSQIPNKNSSKSKTEVADIEVTLIETHANLRILSRKSLRQVSKIVAGFQTLYLTILHLNVTTLDPLVLYTISAKVEEGCQLKSANDIASAVHHMLGIIEEESTLW